MASRLKKIQDRKAAVVKTMQAMSKTCDDEARRFTEEEAKKYEGLKTEMAQLGDDEKIELEIQGFEQSLQPVPDGNQVTPEEEVEANRQQPKADAQKWDNFGQMLLAVVGAAGKHPSQWDQRLKQAYAPSAYTGLGEGVASEGGFLVGTDFVTELLRRTYSNNAVLGAVGYNGPRRIPISAGSNSVKINAVNETSRADGSRWGGVRAYWKEEGGAKSATKPDFRQIELSLKKLIGLCYATDELLQDAAALEAVIMEAFAEEFAFKIQDSLFNGTGAGQPLGILNAGCLSSVAKETGQAAATIVKENVDKMWAAMYARSLPGSVWHINQDCYPQLFSMELTVGTGGQPVYLPPGGLSVSPYGTLMGRPVVPVEQCQTIGTKGDIYYCDWSQYLFADKGGIQTASSIHVNFTYDETVFRFVYRCDGQPSWAAPLAPYKRTGTATVGPFVSLDTRS